MEIKVFLSCVFLLSLIVIILKKVYNLFKSIFVFINKMDKLYNLFFPNGISSEGECINNLKNTLEKQSVKN